MDFDNQKVYGDTSITDDLVFLEETHRLDLYVLYVCEPISCYLIRSMSQFLASRRRTTKHLDCNLYQKCFYCIVVGLFRSNNPQPSVNSVNSVNSENSKNSENSENSAYKQFIARCCLHLWWYFFSRLWDLLRSTFELLNGQLLWKGSIH